MKIRSKLIVIATLPVALLLVLTYVFMAATNEVNRATNKAIIADEMRDRIAALSILTYEHHLYFEDRAHVQWSQKYTALGKQLQGTDALYDDAGEREITARLKRTHRNIGYLFEQYPPHGQGTPSPAETAQEQGFRNRITARLLQELAVAAPAAAKLHDLNHDLALSLSHRIDAASVLVVGITAVVLLCISFLVVRAFSVPVSRLGDAFARVSSGDLGYRINSRTPDELGALSRSFDAMAQRLQESDNSLRVINLELEQRIHERTRELTAANEELTQTMRLRQGAEQNIKVNEERLAALLELSQMKFASEGELLTHSLEEAVRLTRSQVGYLHFFDEAHQTLSLFQWSKAVMAFCTAVKTPHYPLPAAGVWADCVRQRQPVVHNDYPHLATKQGVPEGHFPLLRHMSVPIFEEETIVAVIGVGNKEEPYDDSDIRQLTLYIRSTWEIIKRKRAETWLADSEKRYRTIFTESPDGIVLLDMETAVAVEFNATAHNQLGYTREEFARLSVADYEAKEQPEEIRARFAKIQRLGREKFDTLHRAKTGEIRNVVVSKQTMTLGDRQYLYAIFRDVTALRQAQEESLFKARLLDATSDSIFLVDTTGRVLYVNEAAYTTRGYLREEMIGMPLSALDLPEYAALIPSRIQQILAHGESVFESAHRCKDGRIMPVEIHALCLEVKGERLILGSIRDITERRQNEQARQQYALSLERSNQELEHFAYVASHDLQEPLRKIGSFTELLARKYQDRLDDKALTYIGYIVDGAHRMQILINDLLSLSRVATKGKSFALVECNTLMGQVLLDLECSIQESGARIQAEDLPSVLADDVQLSQVFRNLIGNAIKYRRPQQPPDIRITAQRNGEEWLFAVRDNGIGIDPQHLERIFQLFQRLHTRDEYAGTGIGLALCQKIVERHGGRIWAESLPGSGSTFFFTLPLDNNGDEKR